MSQGRFRTAEDNKVMSAIDMMRDQKAPSAIDGEKVLKHSQAAYDGGNALRSSWKMGTLYLTEKKMIFFQGHNMLFDISLDSLNGVNLIERNWIPGKLVKQLCIIQDWKERKRKFHISVKREEQWKEVIEEQITESRGQKTKRRENSKKNVAKSDICLLTSGHGSSEAK